MAEYYSELELIRLAIRESQLEMNTIIPAKVESYNPTTQKATVVVSINRGINNKVFPPAKIFDVKVVFPRVGNNGFSYKIKKGDHVLLGFCQRDLTQWKQIGEGHGPENNDLFPLDSAVILGGFAPDALTPPQQTNATEVLGEKIFIGDSSKVGPTLTPQVLAPTGLPKAAEGPSSIKQYGPLNLDLISLLVALVENLIVAGYGNDTPPSGGPLMIGGLDTITKGNLEAIAEALKKLKVGV